MVSSIAAIQSTQQIVDVGNPWESQSYSLDVGSPSSSGCRFKNCRILKEDWVISSRPTHHRTIAFPTELLPSLQGRPSPTVLLTLLLIPTRPLSMPPFQPLTVRKQSKIKIRQKDPVEAVDLAQWSNTCLAYPTFRVQPPATHTLTHTALER